MPNESWDPQSRRIYVESSAHSLQSSRAGLYASSGSHRKLGVVIRFLSEHLSDFTFVSTVVHSLIHYNRARLCQPRSLNTLSPYTSQSIQNDAFYTHRLGGFGRTRSHGRVRLRALHRSQHWHRLPANCSRRKRILLGIRFPGNNCIRLYRTTCCSHHHKGIMGSCFAGWGYVEPSSAICLGTTQFDIYAHHTSLCAKRSLCP